MKPIKTLLLLASFSAGVTTLLAQPAPPADAGGAITDPVLLRMQQRAAAERGDSAAPSAAPDELAPATSAPATPAPDMITTPGAVSPGDPGIDTSPSSTSATDIPAGDGIVLNFSNASLDQVLNYLSQAAGFVIVKEATVSGRVSVVSHQPITKDEAIDLLNSVLYRNNRVAIRNGRKLTIVNLDEAKNRGIPVKLWDGDPESIPREDVMTTMILPVRFVAVTELLQNVIPLISPSTPLTANQSGNSIIITDTQNNIRRIAEIIKAVDSGAEDVTVVRVFKLHYASAQEVSDQILNVFANNRNGGMASPMTFAGGAGGRGGRGGAAGGQSRMRTRTTSVMAVPDMRTGSVIVTAPSDQIDNIEKTITELDAEQGSNQEIQMFRVENVEPAEALAVLQDIFQKNGGNTSRNTQNQNNALLNRKNSNSTSFGSSGSRTSSGMGSSGLGGGGTGGGRTTGGGGMTGGFGG